MSLLIGCSGGTKNLSRTDVQLAAGDLRTFGFSAEFLIEQCATGSATTTFCREQAEFISEKIDILLQELNGRSSEAESERLQLAANAANLRGIVERVQQDTISPNDGADAGRLAANTRILEDGLRK